MRSKSKDSGHEYAQTQHVSFDFFDQRASNAPFGYDSYEHYVSLPPAYNKSDSAAETTWPLILFLHGAGESQHNRDGSFVSIRHGMGMDGTPRHDGALLDELVERYHVNFD